MSHAEKDSQSGADSVSDQNREEQAPGLDHGQDVETEGEARTGGAHERGKQNEHGGRVGGASEGSQATGSPDSAG